jgi:hypothetical protein
MDPIVSLNAYDMKPPLTAKFGEEKATEYMKTYMDCIVEGKYGALVTVQTTE